MKRICMMLILLILLLSPCMASDSGEIGDFGGSSAADLLPDEAEKQLEDWQSLDAASAGQRAKSLIAKAFSSSEGKLRQALGLCVSMFGVVLLSSVLRTMAQGDSMGALELAGVLGIAMLAYGQISGFFTQMTGTVDQMAVFSGGLFPALASATAAMGKLGSSTALYAVTTAVCGLVSRGLELVFLPGISCYMALVTADWRPGGRQPEIIGGHPEANHDHGAEISGHRLYGLSLRHRGHQRQRGFCGHSGGKADHFHSGAGGGQHDRRRIGNPAGVGGDGAGLLGHSGSAGAAGGEHRAVFTDGVQLFDAPLYRCRRCCHGRKEAVGADLLHGRGGGAYYGSHRGLRAADDDRLRVLYGRNGGMKAYLIEITAAAILAALIRKLAPKSGAGRGARLGAGLLVLLCLLQPLGRFYRDGTALFSRDWGQVDPHGVGRGFSGGKSPDGIPHKPSRPRHIYWTKPEPWDWRLRSR